MRALQIVVIAAALAVFAGRSSADSTLYLVIANDGTFGEYAGSPEESYAEYYDEGGAGIAGEPVPTYTIVNFMTFIGGSFPFSLTADVHPGPRSGSFGGKQFFFIGTALDGLENTHLMLGDQAGDPAAPGPLDDGFEAALINALFNFAADNGIGTRGARTTLTASDFWNYFASHQGENGFSDVEFASIINGDPANGEGLDFVNWLVYATLDTAGNGSENVFGFTDPALAGVAGVGDDAANGSWQATNPIPEPMTLLLVAGAAGGAFLRRRRK